jgi:high-affinity iron transporter
VIPRLVVLGWVLLWVPPSFGSAPEPGDWHRLVGILQYLEADYPLALESGSEFELAEQRAFIDDALTAAAALGEAGAPFVVRLESVRGRILAAEDPEGVSRECGALIEDLVVAGGLSRSPRHVPELGRGRRLYEQHCASCHAPDGSGQVALAHTMEPPPANFLDPELMGGITPYRAFNTVSFGVNGTAMAGYKEALNEDDRWALSFFLLTLRHPGCDEDPPAVTLEQLSTATDDELAAQFGAHNVPCLRQRLPTRDEEKHLLLAQAGVEDAMRLSGEGDAAGAKRALLDAYLLGVEPVEPLLAARNPGVVRRIEQRVLAMRVAIDKGSPEVAREGVALLEILDEARRSERNSSALAVFWMAWLILLREGFEAMVVVGALLAVLKRMGASAQARWVHVGWVSALVVGGIAFFFGQRLLAGANREWVEGIVALSAVVMLLYAALWLNARSNISAFMKQLRGQLEGALGRGSTAGLFLISFSAVLRESFETALFLQALSIDSPRGAAWGALAGLGALGVLVLVVNKVGYRLPMKTLFSASTILLFATAVMLLGKGLRALQEVGAVPIRPIPMVTVDLLGIYPDLVTLLPQLLLALSPLAWRLSGRGRGSPRPAGAAAGR